MSNQQPTVLHLMRTYGAHGGENQLASYLAAARPEVEGVHENFAFVYRDTACRALFKERGVGAPLFDLWPTENRPGRAWREVLHVLLCLPILQWKLMRLLNRIEPRVCVVHGVQAALIAWPFAMVRHVAGRRFLYVHRIAKASGRSGPARLLYRPYDALAGNSNAVARSLQGLGDVERVYALDNGVDLGRLSRRAAMPPCPWPPAESVDLIAVGRLLPHKNQRLLIEALVRIVRDRPRTTLWIVGDGPERAALQAHAHAQGVGENVFFLGQRADVPALLLRARIFANASGWEGMSNAVLEAMAMGLPSVVVDAPGVTECHEPGMTGIVVPSDAETFAASAISLLADDSLAAHMGQCARKRIEAHYSIEAARRRYIDLFHSLLSEVS